METVEDIEGKVFPQGGDTYFPVAGIYVRVGKEATPRPVSCVEVRAGYGLVGDRHACAQSPQQLLVAGEVAYKRWALPEAALRENLRVDFSTDTLRSGNLLRIGHEVMLWMTFTCEPCSLLERRCPGTLKTIGAQRGVLARVVRGGLIRRGDPVRASRSSIEIMSDDWQQRVLQVARQIPENCLITFRHLADLAGVSTAYCRAFPRVLSRLPPSVASRVGSGAGLRIEGARPWAGAEIFDVEGHLPP